MTDPTQRLLAMVRGHEFEHGNNPVLNWQAGNLVVVQDPAGNLKPQKPDSVNSPAKIDGMVALTMAIAENDSHPVAARPKVFRL